MYRRVWWLGIVGREAIGEEREGSDVIITCLSVFSDASRVRPPHPLCPLADGCFCLPLAVHFPRACVFRIPPPFASTPRHLVYTLQERSTSPLYIHQKGSTPRLHVTKNRRSTLTFTHQKVQHRLFPHGTETSTSRIQPTKEGQQAV